jgi:hypothetical protein
MQIHSVLALKEELRARPRGGVALGVAVGRGAEDYRLAVRITRRDQGVARYVEYLSGAARGEIEVQDVGTIVAPRPLPIEGSAAPAGRARVRPLRPGLSVGHVAVTAGTIGAFVGTPDGRVSILSNHHVLACAGRDRSGGDVVQPGPFDGGDPRADVVGSVWWAPALGAGHHVDAALAELRRDAMYDPGHDGEYLKGPGIARPGMRVGKLGRTTGLTLGRVRAVALDDVVVHYGGGVVHVFDDQIEIESDAGPFSLGGDSGSLVVGRDGEGGLVGVGLLFAGSSPGPSRPARSYANPLGRVLALCRGWLL